MTLEYERLINDTLEVLFGAPPESFHVSSGKKDNKTTFRYKKGIFGHVYAYYGMHETQHCGTLHFHVIVYGGLSPELLDATADINPLCRAASQALDKIYSAELPASVHLTRHLKNYIATDDDLKDNLKHVHQQSNMNPYHQPTPPYKKRKSGLTLSIILLTTLVFTSTHSLVTKVVPGKNNVVKHTCRDLFTVQPVFLTPHSNGTYKALGKPCDEYPPMSSTVIPPKNRPCIRDIRKEPIPAPDLDQNLY